MGITWEECLPAPSLGLSMLPSAPLIPAASRWLARFGDGWREQQIQAGAPTPLEAQAAVAFAAPLLIGLAACTPAPAHHPLLHTICLGGAHFGLIRLLVLGPKLKYWTFLICTYRLLPHRLVIRVPGIYLRMACGS